jgi:DNA-binding NarL/FixJ family response regulator
MDLVLVDDHEALREGLSDLLGRRGFETLGIASTVAEALEVMRQVVPDVTIVDVQLPDGSGLDLTRQLLRDHPDLTVMIYTGVQDAGTLAEALDCGAKGFALKVGGVTKLIQGLRLLARGERYVDPAIQTLLDTTVEGKPLLLTKREREVFDLLAQGLTGEEIAARLTLSPETIRTHIRNGMEKLDAHTRTGAVVRALKAHEIQP